MSYIPEKIMYVCPKENMTTLYRNYKISQVFEEMNDNKILIKSLTKSDALDSYPVDAENITRIESAKKWAKNHRSYRNSTSDVTSFEIENLMSGLRIVSLEFRGEGGRAYKCITPHGFLVDLREDILMDIITNVGIGKNGYIKCDFVWGAIGAQMKIIRKGSDVYNELVKETKTRMDDLKAKEEARKLKDEKKLAKLNKTTNA